MFLVMSLLQICLGKHQFGLFCAWGKRAGLGSQSGKRVCLRGTYTSETMVCYSCHCLTYFELETSLGEGLVKDKMEGDKCEEDEDEEVGK